MHLFHLMILTTKVSLSLQKCWEENQTKHQISDLKDDNQTFTYLALDIEEGFPGALLGRRIS